MQSVKRRLPSCPRCGGKIVLEEDPRYGLFELKCLACGRTRETLDSAWRRWTGITDSIRHYEPSDQTLKVYRPDAIGRPIGRPGALDDEDRDQILTDYRRGGRAADLARRFSVSIGTIYNIIRQSRVDM